MHLLSSSIFTAIGTAILLIINVEATSPNNLIVAAANFNHLNPLQATPQMHQHGDIQPVSYLYRDSPRRFLYPKNRFNRHHQKKKHHKRDYATTLRLLKAAMQAYKKDFVTPPPVSMMELPPAPVTAATPLPPSPAVMAANPIIMPAQDPPPPSMAQPAVAELAPPADLKEVNPLIPDLTQGQPQQPEEGVDSILPTPELGNEMTESTKLPKSTDIEEDDSYDPEEDPDDVDDPPVVNGVAVDREE